jgi:transcription antitermination factor NusG
MGASLRPKGAAFPKGKPVRVREKKRGDGSSGEAKLSDSLELGPGERWFVARVLAHQENRAQFNLHRLGFRNFLPRLRRTVRHARKLRDTLSPLFPGYIFIVIDLSKHRWRSINGTFGVASLIMGGEQPMPVPPGVVEALVASYANCGAIRLDDGLEIGQKVRILSGPFAETICRLAHLDDRGRVRVLLEIMGMEVATQLDRSAIASAA